MSFDRYTTVARLGPVASATLPFLALFFGGLIQLDDLPQLVTTILGGGGLILAALIRDRGRSLEPGLWASWGGSPTLRRLRYRGNDQGDVSLLHARIEEALSVTLPGKGDEAADPAGADRRYEDATARLRELTRDGETFKLLLAENIQYGYRRNCLGVRRFAIAAALVCALADVALLFMGSTGSDVLWAGFAVVSLVLALFWWRVVTPEWVRTAGELYATRLFEAVETLRHERQDFRGISEPGAQG